MGILQLSAVPIDNKIILRIGGLVDSETSVQLKKKIDLIIADENRFIICNLENVKQITSAGYGILIQANEILSKKKGKILLCSMQRSVQKMYEKMGFSNIFEIYDTEDEALKSQ